MTFKPLADVKSASNGNELENFFYLASLELRHLARVLLVMTKESSHGKKVRRTPNEEDSLKVDYDESNLKRLSSMW
jgi:hypothetical protein